MRKSWIILSLVVLIVNITQAQNHKKETDTIQAKNLPDVTVAGRNSKSDYQQMPEIVGTNIYAGKKNALIVLDNVQGNVVTNNMRQVLAKVPAFIYGKATPATYRLVLLQEG